MIRKFFINITLRNIWRFSHHKAYCYPQMLIKQAFLSLFVITKMSIYLMCVSKPIKVFFGNTT